MGMVRPTLHTMVRIRNGVNAQKAPREKTGYSAAKIINLELLLVLKSKCENQRI